MLQAGVFAATALAIANVAVIADPFDLLHPLDHLVAVHGICTQAQGSAVHIRQGLIVHAPRQDGFVLHCHGNVQALVVGLGRAAIVGVAHVPVGGDHHVPGVFVFLHEGEYVA